MATVLAMPDHPLRLSRRVRFSIPLSLLQIWDEDRFAALLESPRSNTYAGWPAPGTPSMYAEVDVVCSGSVDTTTGYLLGIGDIDIGVRDVVFPPLARALAGRGVFAHPAELIRRLVPQLSDHLGGLLESLRWRLTPTYSVLVETRDMDRFFLSQSFDFAAAHHLGCDSLDAEENVRVFGKCLNQHGHNYRLEVVVQSQFVDGAATFTLETLERIVEAEVLDRFDHTDLNQQTDTFGTRMPSVEHISRVCHDLLAPVIAEAGGTLAWVTTWETEKTSCTYPARVFVPLAAR